MRNGAIVRESSVRQATSDQTAGSKVEYSTETNDWEKAIANRLGVLTIQRVLAEVTLIKVTG